MSEKLRIVLPKGRICQEASAFLKAKGFPVPEDLEESRRLVLPLEGMEMDLILAKPMDVPTYVEYGVADLGIAGKDVLMETGRDVYELLDLGISPCRLSVAGYPGAREASYMPRIATKYPNVAARYFREKGQQVEIIHLNGSIELAPILGLAERIVDIVATGQTLRENGLVELEVIAEITGRLIANRMSYRMKAGRIDEVVKRLETGEVHG